MPEYLLRSPERTETPFSEVLKEYSGFIPGQNWLDLHQRMRLRVENAYYGAGLPKHGLNGFLGTEIAVYRVSAHGALRLIATDSKLAELPADQPPVTQLLPGSQMRWREHRFFLAIKFSKRTEATPSVLLSANSGQELHALAARLETAPDTVCGAGASHCVVFPEACSVSAEIEILVNNVPRTVVWGSTLASLTSSPRRVQLRRLYSGHSVPVKLDPFDPEALRLPLLPGDRLVWE